MEDRYPTKRPIDTKYARSPAAGDDERLSDLLNLPWIDIHNHAHTLSWDDREKFALSGCRAMVMVAYGYHWAPYRPVSSDDVRFLWDTALNRRDKIDRSHFFTPRLALGVHTGCRVTESKSLPEALAGYAELDEVVAIGEIGITPSQYACEWGLKDQQEITRAQMSVASEHDLPVILHTPNSGTDQPPYRSGHALSGFETNSDLGRETILDAEEVELESVKLDIQMAAKAGLSEDRVIASHADGDILHYLMAETDCYVSFTIGPPWLLGVTVADVAEAIREYGPERIMIETDSANVLRSDVYSVKRAIFELYRMGIDIRSIKQVVYENQIDLLGEI